MSPEQEALITTLLVREIDEEEFLRRWGVDDGARLGLDLVRDAVARRDGDDFERGMTVSFRFGFTDEHLPLLLGAFDDEWHTRHEDVVSAIVDYRLPSTVELLVRATQWVPEHLEWDDARALATKAIYGLATIPGDDAEQALRRLLDEPDEVVRECAAHNLRRRAEHFG